jgi:hypothetical protein
VGVNELVLAQTGLAHSLQCNEPQMPQTKGPSGKCQVDESRCVWGWTQGSTRLATACANLSGALSGALQGAQAAHTVIGAPSHPVVEAKARADADDEANRPRGDCAHAVVKACTRNHCMAKGQLARSQPSHMLVALLVQRRSRFMYFPWAPFFDFHCPPLDINCWRMPAMPPNPRGHACSLRLHAPVF